jgi:APA family basic amino acid/polyamine antiporter
VAPNDGAGEVTLVRAVAVEVGLIVGGALFSLTGVAVGIAGPGVAVSFAIAFGIAVLGLVPTAMLGAAFPTTGGNYRYPARFVSRPLAFLAAWGLAVSMLGGGLPLYGITAGQYVDGYLPVGPAVVGFLLLTAFYLVNLLGVRAAATAQLALFVGLVAALGSFVVLGVPAVDPANLSPPFPSGAVGVLTAAGVLYFVCLGANFVVDIGGEVRDATVTIPRSFAVSVPLVLALYAGISLVAVGVAGTDAMAGATLAVPAELFLSGALGTLFVVGGALFAIATSVNAVYIVAPRYLEALAEDGLVPAALARENDRFGTAHWSLTLVYGLSAVAVFSPLPIADLGSLLGFGGAFLVVPVMLAALAAVRDPATDAASVLPLPSGAIAAMAALAVPLNLLLLGLLATQTPAVFLAWVGLLGLGGAYYLLRTRTGPRPTAAGPTDP